MGADTKANTRELVRAPGGLLERAQRGVAFDALSESSSSSGTEAGDSQTASTRDGGTGAEECQRALTRKRTLGGGGALEVGDLRILEDGGECSGTLLSDPVDSETASEG